MTDATRTAVQAVAAVMADLSHVAKRDTNSQQGFQFRGIDAVVNAVGPVLRTHGVVVAPMVERYDHGEVLVGGRRTPMSHARVTVRYRWYGPCGDYLDSIAVGEAFDSGDKATAKAMSVAFRTCLLQTLALPTDEADPDHDTYERAPSRTTDVQWLADFQERIPKIGNKDDWMTADAERRRAYEEGRLVDEDWSILDRQMRERAAELRGSTEAVSA